MDLGRLAQFTMQMLKGPIECLYPSSQPSDCDNYCHDCRMCHRCSEHPDPGDDD